MACPSSFLLLLLDFSTLPLALILLLILLGVVFNFGSVGKKLWPRGSMNKEEMFLVLEPFLFLFLFVWLRQNDG